MMETQTTGWKVLGGPEPRRRQSVQPPSQVDGTTHDVRPQLWIQVMYESVENGDRRKTGFDLDSSWLEED